MVRADVDEHAITSILKVVPNHPLFFALAEVIRTVLLLEECPFITALVSSNVHRRGLGGRREAQRYPADSENQEHRNERRFPGVKGDQGSRSWTCGSPIRTMSARGVPESPPGGCRTAV